MRFYDHSFLFLLLTAMLAAGRLPGRWRTWGLLAGSLVFLGRGALPGAVAGLSCWLLGKAIAGGKGGWRLLPGALILAAGLGAAWYFCPLPAAVLALNGIAYLRSVSREGGAGSLSEAALYLLFFPKATAGPIVPWPLFRQQLTAPKPGFGGGCRMLVAGLGKLCLLAPALAELCRRLHMSLFWAVCFGLLLWAGLGGWLDMARGVSRMLGFSFSRGRLSHRLLILGAALLTMELPLPSGFLLPLPFLLQNYGVVLLVSLGGALGLWRWLGRRLFRAGAWTAWAGLVWYGLVLTAAGLGGGL